MGASFAGSLASCAALAARTNLWCTGSAAIAWSWWSWGPSWSCPSWLSAIINKKEMITAQHWVEPVPSTCLPTCWPRWPWGERAGRRPSWLSLDGEQSATINWEWTAVYIYTSRSWLCKHFLIRFLRPTFGITNPTLLQRYSQLNKCIH